LPIVDFFSVLASITIARRSLYFPSFGVRVNNEKPVETFRGFFMGFYPPSIGFVKKFKTYAAEVDGVHLASLLADV
jgi:hypothetical protein